MGSISRNLRHLFTWLEETCGHAHPWTAELQRYAPAKKRPSTLAQEFIADLLKATGGGKARRFEDVRDHAIIRVLTEGVRRTELIQLQTSDLSTDLIAQPFVRVVPLKGGRGAPRPDRAADRCHGAGRGGVSAGAAVASAGGHGGAVAGSAEPRGRVRRSSFDRGARHGA